jgi:hypothetical protein
MNGTKKRMAILLVAIATIGGLLACSTSSLLSRSSEPTATPTKTPKPTFTVTLTPTQTPIPTNTPRPTNTPTPVTPTNTPLILTATFTPLPTDTPAPTNTPLPPTNTPRPTSRPRPRATSTPTRRPQPTNTPKPQFPWRGTAAGSFPNCGYTGLMGLTLDRSGGVAGDVWLHYWADGWNGGWARSSWTVNQGYAGQGDEKNWDGFIDNYPKPGTWYVCVVAQEGSWDCISDKMTAVTVSEPCAPGSDGVQVARFVFQQN